MSALVRSSCPRPPPRSTVTMIPADSQGIISEHLQLLCYGVQFTVNLMLLCCQFVTLRPVLDTLLCLLIFKLST